MCLYLYLYLCASLCVFVCPPSLFRTCFHTRFPWCLYFSYHNLSSPSLSPSASLRATPSVRWYGRTLVDDAGAVRIDWAGTEVEFTFTGTTSVQVVLEEMSANLYRINLDGEFQTRIETDEDVFTYTVRTRRAGAPCDTCLLTASPHFPTAGDGPGSRQNLHHQRVQRQRIQAGGRRQRAQLCQNAWVCLGCASRHDPDPAAPSSATVHRRLPNLGLRHAECPARQ